MLGQLLLKYLPDSVSLFPWTHTNTSFSRFSSCLTGPWVLDIETRTQQMWSAPSKAVPRRPPTCSIIRLPSCPPTASWWTWKPGVEDWRKSISLSDCGVICPPDDQENSPWKIILQGKYHVWAIIHFWEQFVIQLIINEYYSHSM